jgi:hypothetical protein
MTSKNQRNLKIALIPAQSWDLSLAGLGLLGLLLSLGRLIGPGGIWLWP